MEESLWEYSLRVYGSKDEWVSKEIPVVFTQKGERSGVPLNVNCTWKGYAVHYNGKTYGGLNETEKGIWGEQDTCIGGE